MVEFQSQAPDLDRTFQALADPTRRSILGRLRDGAATVSQLAAPFEMSLNAVSKHLRVLEGAGLIRREVRGREHHCHLEATPIHKAADWTNSYRSFWEDRLDALDGFLRSETAGSGSSPKRQPPSRSAPSKRGRK